MDASSQDEVDHRDRSTGRSGSSGGGSGKKRPLEDVFPPAPLSRLQSSHEVSPIGAQKRNRRSVAASISEKGPTKAPLVSGGSRLRKPLGRPVTEESDSEEEWLELEGGNAGE